MTRPPPLWTERRFVAWCITAIIAIVVAHSIWLVGAAALDAPRPAGVGLVGFGIAIALIGIAATRRLVLAGVTAAVIAGFAAALQLGPRSITALAVAAIAGAAIHELGQPRLERRAPDWVDGAWDKHRRVATVWGLLALACVGQTARLSAFMVDSSMTRAATVPFKDADHQCLSAFLHAAELNRAGAERIYDREHYNNGTTDIAGMQRFMKDRYLYPPPFLVAPRLAIAVTNDYDLIRSAWFVARVAGIGVVLILIGFAVRGRGPVAALLIPAVWISAPVQLDLQFGQAHLATLACAMAAMLAFERDRHHLGGALLAIAIWTKIFPGILVVYLAARGRWRALASTAAWGVGLLIVGVAVLGPEVHAEYLNSAMPAMARGDTFVGLDPANLADDLAIYSLPFRLELLGAPAMGHGVAGGLTWIYSAALVVLAFIAGRRDSGWAPLVWLGLLNLAALRSPYAPGIYVAAGVVWLLSLAIAASPARRSRIAALAGVWLLVMANPFLARLPVFRGSTTLLMTVAIIVQVAVVACCLAAVLRRTRATTR